MPKLVLDVPDLLFARLNALALARNEAVDQIATGVLDSFAASAETRQKIRKARRKAGNSSLADWAGWMATPGSRSTN